MAGTAPIECGVRQTMWSRRTLLKTIGMALGGGFSLVLGSCSGSTSHTVEMISEEGEEFFKPDRLRIRPGDSVCWVLTSGFHSATAYHPANTDHPLRIPETAAAWDSGLLRVDGQQFEVTFEHEGVYGYYCTPHEALGMVGVLVVGDALNGKPGLAPPQADLPNAAREKLTELITWARQFQP